MKTVELPSRELPSRELPSRELPSRELPSRELPDRAPDHNAETISESIILGGGCNGDRGTAKDRRNIASLIAVWPDNCCRDRTGGVATAVAGRITNRQL
jgi:hypothetical protein